MKNSTIREVAKLEAAMEANPPVIVWRHNGRGVQIAVRVDDPHMEKGWAPRPAADLVEPFLEYVELPECTNETLLAAARTEI
jgi:hypothetical protein